MRYASKKAQRIYSGDSGRELEYLKGASASVFSPTVADGPYEAAAIRACQHVVDAPPVLVCQRNAEDLGVVVRVLRAPETRTCYSYQCQFRFVLGLGVVLVAGDIAKNELWNGMEGGIELTNYHGAYDGMIENPACGDVRDAEAAVAGADVAEDAQKLLKQVPGVPGLDDHVEIL
jgi:hypothetical protein